MTPGLAPKAKPSLPRTAPGTRGMPSRRPPPRTSSSWVWSLGSSPRHRSRTKAQAGSPDPLPLHARLSTCTRPCQAGRPCRQGSGSASAQDLLCTEALAVEMPLLEGVGIAQAKGAYAKARQENGNVTAKDAAACDEHPAFKQACHFPGVDHTSIAVEPLGQMLCLRRRSIMALLSEQAQCCAMRTIPSRRTRTMPSTPQMVSSRKRTGRLVFSLSSSGRLLSFMETPKARQSQERALVFRPILLSKTACGPVCRNKAAEMPCPAICLPHPEQLLSMKECSEREKALPFPAFLAPYHAKKPRNSPKKNRGRFLAPGNAVWSDCQGLHLAWDAFRAPGN